MNRLWTAHRRRRAAASRGHAPEGGFTLVELMVAMAASVIALTITAEVVNAVTKDSSTQLAQGRETVTGQVALNGVAEYLQGAVTPLSAYAASDDESLETSVTSGSWCWDNTYPGPAPQSPLIGTDPSGTSYAASPYPADTPMVPPDSLSIIYAHDYSVELCAYPPGTTTPRVYQLYMPYSTCTSTGSKTSVGDCTLKVVEYPTSYTASSDYDTPANGTVVDQVHDVWCDLGCQEALPGYTGSSPTNGSCWSYLTTVSGESVPSACSTITTTDETSFTPPLFTYQGGSTLASTENLAATYLDLSCYPGSSSCDPTVPSSLTSTPVCQAAASVPSGVTATDDALCLTQAHIQSVLLRMTVLGDANQATSVSSAAVTPKTTVSETISLPNLTSEDQS